MTSFHDLIVAIAEMRAFWAAHVEINRCFPSSNTMQVRRPES
jgi:hypothetical protein